MSALHTPGRLRPLLRGTVTLSLLACCFLTEVFLLPTFRAMLSRNGGGEMTAWATAPLGWVHWLFVLTVVGSGALIYRAKREARSSMAATALALVDVVLVLWVISIGLVLLEFVITIPRLI